MIVVRVEVAEAYTAEQAANAFVKLGAKRVSTLSENFISAEINPDEIDKFAVWGKIEEKVKSKPHKR